MLRNKCIVNEYRPGQGITWHTDAPCFGDTIACFVLLSPGTPPSPMEFRLGGWVEAVAPPAGSLYLMRGHSRAPAQHRMPPLKAPAGVPTPTRISVTFRTVEPTKK